MEWTGLNELREKYLSFFESKEHLRLESASLIPKGDKSLLLINAGMAPLKKFFTGEVTPPRRRCTSCQKCIRTPDIERVGKTARHGTYFEMLGNFSFGDYFKREACGWAWEFFTEVLKLPADKLYCSIFLEDDEAFDIWTKEIGVDPSHVVRLGREDNFWEHGAGPCGPCSEIYFDRGESYGCGKPDCAVGCDCDRFIEVWNLVFTQFENDGNNNYTRLANPNIDTGMGLERLACVMQGVDNLFEVDTVRNIMKHVEDIAGVEYHTDAKNDVSIRVITDHIRSTVFMICDGVLPSNVGRGYVLRRLLRRAARHGRLLGIDTPFLSGLVEVVVRENSGAYPELLEKQDYITKIIAMEEDSFSKTIDSGLSELNELIERAQNGVLSGADAFRLQDTKGFPIDLTKEILSEHGMTVDEEEFNSLLEKAKATARAARKDAGADAWKNASVTLDGIAATRFVGYGATEHEAVVLALVGSNGTTDVVTAEDEAALVLDVTPFYAQSGGQVGDTGEIVCGDVVFTVTDTTKTAAGHFLHRGYISTGEALSVGSRVVCSVCPASRTATARNHTAAHLLHAALKKILGTHVAQAGQFVSPDVVRFDFSHFAPLTGEELIAVEDAVNTQILNAVAVNVVEMSIEDAKKSGATALFDEKYGDVVRVVSCGDFSKELCGGTHVSNTGEIGLFRVVSETSSASGIRRIEAVTGYNSLNYVRAKEQLLHTTAAALKITNLGELDTRASAVAAELKAKDRELEELKSQLAKVKSEQSMDTAIDVKGLKLFIANIGEATANDVRSICDASKDKGDDIVVLSAASQTDKGTLSFACYCAPEAVKRGAHAGNFVREIAKLTGGSGGGKPDSAMAGGKDISKLNEALDAAQGVLEAMVK